MINAVLITKEQLKTAQILSPYERILENGIKVTTNVRGEISNRLLSWRISEVRRNAYTDRKDIKAFLNLINVPQKVNGTYIPGLRMALTMQDLRMKTNYIIPINIGGILTFILMRDKIKTSTNVRKLKNDFIEQHFNEIIITQLYKDMLTDNCRFPVLVEEDDYDDNKVMLKTKIDITRVDSQIPVLV